MTRYYCSGFDTNNAFGHGLGTMFKAELGQCQNLLYIPAGSIEKAKKMARIFDNHFQKDNINFANRTILTDRLSSPEAKELVNKADFIMLIGGNPLLQKELCEKLDIIPELKNHSGIMLGFSAGAMLMSKKIIIIPCSEQYPELRIEDGLNLDGLSILPHNNTAATNYPETVDLGKNRYKRQDIINASKQAGTFYLLQDHFNGQNFDISIIKSHNGQITGYTEHQGKIWKVQANTIRPCFHLEKL